MISFWVGRFLNCTIVCFRIKIFGFCIQILFLGMDLLGIQGSCPKK